VTRYIPEWQLWASLEKNDGLLRAQENKHSVGGVLDIANIGYRLTDEAESGAGVAEWEARIVLGADKSLCTVSYFRHDARRHVMRVARRLGYTWFHSHYQDVSARHLALIEAAFEMRGTLKPRPSIWLDPHNCFSHVGRIGCFADEGLNVVFYCDGVSAGIHLGTTWESDLCGGIYAPECNYATPTSNGYRGGAYHFGYTYFRAEHSQKSELMEKALLVLGCDARFPFSFTTDARIDPTLLRPATLTGHQKIAAWRSYRERTREWGESATCEEATLSSNGL
jgi:hypothetical protein